MPKSYLIWSEGWSRDGNVCSLKPEQDENTSFTRRGSKKRVSAGGVNGMGGLQDQTSRKQWSSVQKLASIEFFQ